MTRKQIFIVLGIFAVGIFFRFYLLNQMPGGLFPDEAANGLDINLMEQGYLQPFYERGNGREALFFYMIWFFVKIFGRIPFAHHLTSALVGTGAVLAAFFVARNLFRTSYDNRELAAQDTKHRSAYWIGVITMFLVATSSWHVVLSRTAFRANLIPLAATLAFICFLHVFTARENRKRLLWAALFGASMAAGFYTYIAFRILVFIFVPLILWPAAVELIVHRSFAKIKQYILPTIVAGIAFAAVFSPLGYYFHTHPGSFVGRSGQVSVFNEDLNQGRLVDTIVQVTKDSMLAYVAHGDLNWRHNISGFPFISPIVSAFFVIGLLFAFLRGVRYLFRPSRYSKDYPYFLMCGWFFGMLLPVITTAEGIPHGLRAIGTIPVVFIMTAWGMYYTGRFIYTALKRIHEKYHGQLLYLNTFSWVTIGAIAIALISQTYVLYFVKAYNSPENFYAFRSDLTVVSQYLNEHGDKLNTYLVLDKFSVQTVDYMTTHNAAHPHLASNQPYKQVDPEHSHLLNNLKPGDKIVFCQSSIFDIKKFKQYHPEAHLSFEQRNKFGQAVLAVYEIQ